MHWAKADYFTSFEKIHTLVCTYTVLLMGEPMLHKTFFQHTSWKLCPLAEAFVTDRWRQECGWNYTDLSAVTLCPAVSPMKKINGEEDSLRAGAPPVQQAAHTTLNTTLADRVDWDRGKCETSCLKSDLPEKLSPTLENVHRAWEWWLQPLYSYAAFCFQLHYFMRQNR